MDQLQWGDRYKIIQYMLLIMHIDESTYEGNDKIIKVMLEYLGFKSTDELKRVGLEHVIVWVGDQLTMSKLRGL